MFPGPRNQHATPNAATDFALVPTFGRPMDVDNRAVQIMPAPGGDGMDGRIKSLLATEMMHLTS